MFLAEVEELAWKEARDFSRYGRFPSRHIHIVNSWVVRHFVLLIYEPDHARLLETHCWRTIHSNDPCKHEQHHFWTWSTWSEHIPARRSVPKRNWGTAEGLTFALEALDVNPSIALGIRLDADRNLLLDDPVGSTRLEDACWCFHIKCLVGRPIAPSFPRSSARHSFYPTTAFSQA